MAAPWLGAARRGRCGGERRVHRPGVHGFRDTGDVCTRGSDTGTGAKGVIESLGGLARPR